MMIYKVFIVAVITSICALSLKRENEHISVLILIAGGIIIAVFCVGMIFNIAGEIENIFSYTGMDGAYLRILFKCLGICLITQFASDICNDASHTALAGQIILAGKVCIIALSMPLFSAVLKIITGLIKG